MKRTADVQSKMKLNYHVCFYLLAILFIGFTSTLRGTDLMAAFLILISLAAMSMWLLRYRSRALTVILFTAFVSRLLLAITQSFIMPLPDSSIDAVVFERLGWDVASAWNNGTPPPVTRGAYLYSKFIALVYYTAGHNPFLIQYINVILGVLTVYIVYKMVRCFTQDKGTAPSRQGDGSFVFSEKTKEPSPCLASPCFENRHLTRSEMPAVVAALIAALYPTLNLYSAITVRENMITFFSLFSVYCFLKWLKSGSVKEIIKSGVLLVAAGALHGAVILIGGVFVFFFCFYRPKLGKWGFVNKQTVLLVLGIIVVFGLFKSVLLNKIPSDLTLLLSPEYLKSRVEPLAVGRGAYLAGYYPASVFDIFLQTPVRVVYFLFGPFPWKITGLADFIGFIDAFMYAILIVYSLKSFGKLDKYGKLMYLAILLIVFVEVITFAWGTSNYGTAVRHRQKIICFLIVAASFGMARNREVKAGNGE
jgi:hypothetical protein